MSYVKITCPYCYSKWEVSKYYFNLNKNVSKADLAKQLCTCVNKINIPSLLDVDSYRSRLSKIIKVRKEKDKKKLPGAWLSMTKNNIFVDNI